jgi:hypothetical protein
MQHSPENVPSAGVTDRGDTRRGFGGAWPLAALALILLMLLPAIDTGHGGDEGGIACRGAGYRRRRRAARARRAPHRILSTCRPSRCPTPAPKPPTSN